MSRGKRILNQVGITQDNDVVLGGMFKMYDTHGVPLADCIDLLEEAGYIPGFHDFVMCAQKAGWKLPKIKAVLREAIIDVYGDFGVAVWDKVNSLIIHYFESEKKIEK